MVTVEVVLSILIIHWVADFVLQSDWMAINKSKNNLALLAHVFTYCNTWGIVGLFFFGFIPVALFYVYNFILHFITDYCTSRLNAYLWEKEMRHWFFVAIGFDQVIHYTCLFLTYAWLL